MHVPQFMPWIGNDEYEGMRPCFESQWITEGPKTKEFEEKLLALIGARYGVFAPNGTLALYLGLRALGIGPSDEVLVPDFTFMGSATAVEMTGAIPVFVDVNTRNFQIDLAHADALGQKKTKAIMPVHIYGTIADMDAVSAFAKRHGLLVIEDAAQAIGVRRNGKHAGSWGDVSCFSFFADKTITTGEGGFIVTNDEATYEKLRLLRNQGRRDRGTFIHPAIGYNFRITDMQAAIGLVQLGKLQEIVERKKTILQWYKTGLKDIKDITFFEPDPGTDWIPFRVGILLKKAHALMEHLKTKDIEPRTFFYPLHKQPCLAHLVRGGDEQFPNAIFGYEHGVCLPTFPTLKKEQVQYVCEVIKKFLLSA